MAHPSTNCLCGPWAQHLDNYHDHRSLTHSSSSLAHVELDSRLASVGPESGPPSCTQAPGWSLICKHLACPPVDPGITPAHPMAPAVNFPVETTLCVTQNLWMGWLVKDFLLKHLVKTRRGAHFLKCADSSVSHKDHESSGKHDTIKGN